jgi:plastocyanin
MRTPLLLASLLFAVPLIGCGDSTGGSGSSGGGDDSTTSSTGDATTGSTATGNSSSSGSSGADVEDVDCAGATPAATITNDGLAFDPPTVTISVGDVIEFTPSGTHDMTAADDSWGTPTGQGGCLKFNAAGDHDFKCSIHPTAMTGTVTVN